MKPSDFTKHPFDSMLHNNECETVARNIMVILARTGDEFRLLEWNEYMQQRKQDGYFTALEQRFFDRVVGFCVSEASALAFCKNWA